MSIFLGSEAEEIGSVFERIGTTKHTHTHTTTYREEAVSAKKTAES